MFDCGECCTSDEAVSANDSGDQLQPLLSTSESQDSTSFDDQANTLNADYKEVTPLFRAIELEDWKGILLFLTTGRWSSSLLTSTYTHLQDPSAERQARTWIKCRDKEGDTQWRQLPLHAAISYMAPLPIVQKILGLHHDAVRSADDTGNLPLHLAFGFGSPDNVVAYLIKEYPQALYIKGLQNRRPLDCCDLGPNKSRGKVIQACQAHTREFMMKDWDQHWKRSLIEAQKKASITEPISAKCKTLEDVFSELMQVKIELKKAKEMVKNRPTMIITKTEPVPPITNTIMPIGKSLSNASKVFALKKKGSFNRGLKKKFLRPLKSSSSSAQVAPLVTNGSEF